MPSKLLTFVRKSERKESSFPHTLETKLDDFAQEYGKIDYNDIAKLERVWDSIDVDTQFVIKDLIAKIRREVKGSGMDAGELASEDVGFRRTCDKLVSIIKSVISRSRKESIFKKAYQEK